MEPFDMHIHSYYSDGTDSPTAIVRAAKVRGLKMISLTDHDSILGVAEAAKAGEREDIKVLSGIEFNTVHPSELHILGWGFDMHNDMLKQTLDWLCGERERRNASMLAKLRTLQCDAAPYLEPIKGNLTRLHIANALVAGGYASSKGDAFERYLKKGRPAMSRQTAFRPRMPCGLSYSAGVWPQLRIHVILISLLNRLSDALKAAGWELLRHTILPQRQSRRNTTLCLQSDMSC